MEMMGTTICAVRRNGKIAVAGDGQITMGQSVILKGTAKKVKRIYDDKVVIGFAGSVSDAISLSEKFEKMLQKYSGNLMRSAVELAELWRDDKLPRKLEAMMIVADKNNLLIVSVIVALSVRAAITHLQRPELCLKKLLSRQTKLRARLLKSQANFAYSPTTTLS